MLRNSTGKPPRAQNVVSRMDPGLRNCSNRSGALNGADWEVTRALSSS